MWSARAAASRSAILVDNTLTWTADLSIVVEHVQPFKDTAFSDGRGLVSRMIQPGFWF